MIYDCFLFFNELDLLKIRLEELRPVVDRFVLVEATRTYSGASKPLYFERHRQLFADHADVIEHHVVTALPRLLATSRWVRQVRQRDAIGAALARAGCQPDDVILVSDVDEIPRAEAIAPALEQLASHDLVIFEQTHHEYHVGNVRQAPWLGTLGCRYRLLQRVGSAQRLRFGSKRARRAGTVSTRPELERRYPRIADGGWHLSWLGGPDAVLYKQQSVSHCERDPSPERQLPYIRATTGWSGLLDGPRCGAGEGSTPWADGEAAGSLPRYLAAHRQRFAHFFEPVADPTRLAPGTELHDPVYCARRRLYGRLEHAVERLRRAFWRAALGLGALRARRRD